VEFVKMKLCATYYYDRPILAAWLNHYCQFDCIDEILIQDQNWSPEDSVYLQQVVSDYISEYGKNIVVSPSHFKRIEGDKYAQFGLYGLGTIRNSMVQRFKNFMWILGQMDEAIYQESYEETENKLREFEEVGELRAKEGLNTVGFLHLYSVFKEGIFPSGMQLQKRLTNPVWKSRIYRFVDPFRMGEGIHDDSMESFTDGKWGKRVLRGGYEGKTGDYRELELKIIHYHTLIRRDPASPEFFPVPMKDIENLEQHPFHYLVKLVS